MEIKVVIDQDIIDANSEASSHADEITIEGKAFSCTHEPTYLNFCKKIPAFLKDRRNVDLKHTVSATGERVTWVTIISNSNTAPVFDIFKSMGMYMAKLTVGVSESAKTLYTSSKLCRDLNKYSEAQRAAIMMYMLSIAYFVEMSEKLLIKYELDPITNSVKVPDDSVAKTLRPFKGGETWYLKDSNDDNYSAVMFHNTEYVFTNDQYASTNLVKIGMLKHASGALAGVAMVKLGAASYAFVVSEKITYTNFDLCNIEISSDSLCAYVANAFPKNMSLKKVTELPLSKDMTFVDLESEELSEVLKAEKVPKWLGAWITTMIGKGANVADADMLAPLCKHYGVAMPAGSGSAPSLSLDEMREQYKDDAYAQELYKQVKPYYDSYVLGTELDANLRGFSNGAIYAMAFIGESGTGKSTAARVIPARCGIPYISVNFSVNIEEADLFGSMVPNAKKAKPEDPEFVWADGIITKAVRSGYCVILEELNFARPGVLGKLNSLLDENRQVDLSTGEIVRAHPNFRIIATCNIAYEGTNRFNKALINRFDDVTVFRDLPRNEAIAVIKSRTGYSSAAKIGKVYDVYEALKKFATEQNVNAVVSMRQLLNIFTKGKYYSNAKDAVQRIMINGAFIEDNEYQKVFEETVFTAFDLKFKI